MKLLLILIILSSVLISSLVYGGTDRAGVYIGGSASYVVADESVDNSIGWKGYVGYQFNNYLAIEAAWMDAGTFEEAPGYYNANIDLDGYSASIVGLWPINDELSTFVKAGMYFWSLEGEVDYGYQKISGSDEGSDLLLGLGIQYFVSDNIGIRAEWEYINDVSDSSVSFISAGVLYQF